MKRLLVALLLLGISVGVGLGYGELRFYELTKENATLKDKRKKDNEFLLDTMLPAMSRLADHSKKLSQEKADGDLEKATAALLVLKQAREHMDRGEVEMASGILVALMVLSPEEIVDEIKKTDLPRARILMDNR